MRNLIVKRTLALASCIFMLAGDVIPAYAEGTPYEGQTTVVVAETADGDTDEDEKVSDNTAASENETDNEENTASENKADNEEGTVSENDSMTDGDTVSENDTAAEEDTEDDKEDNVSAAKPSGNPVATAALGDNVTGSIYKDGAKVILYVDGRGTSMNTEFKESTLSGYPITDVIFGGEVSKLYDGAFADVTSIQRVVFSGDITYIAHESFMGCTSLTSLTFEKGSGHLDICDKAFKGCTRLNNVTIPKRVGKQVGSGGEYYGVFSECSSLTNAALEDGITLVPANTFVGASALTNISIPSSVTAIGDGAFEACSSLKAFIFPANVKSIGESAFAGTAFSSFIIPGTVTAIGSWAFEDCRELKSVGFEKGSSTLEMADGIFKNCVKLESITLPKRIGKSLGSETDYYSIFTGCTSLTTAALEDGITYVPKNAFAFAPALKYVIIPSSVKTIGDNAFNGCVRIGAITLPNNLTALGQHAFDGCTSLTSITIPNKVKKIPDYCFFGCSVLSEIRLSDSITEVGHRSFDGCYSLEKVYCSKDKSKIKIGDLNDHLKNAQWIKVAKGGKEETKTGVITLNGVAVNSLKAAFKQMKDKNKDYMIVLGSDIAGEKNLTIPSTAKSVTINGNGHMVEITGTKLTSNVPLTLNNIKFRAVSKKGAASKFTVNAKKDLTINTAIAFEAKSASVRSGAKLSLNCGLSADKVSSKDLSIGAAGVLTAVKSGSISVKNLISGTNGSSISLAEGFKPIKLGGGAEGIIKINGVKVADGTQILKTSAKKLNEDTLKAVFDVSGIKTSTVSAHLYYYGSKACIFADAISFNGKTYGVWETVVADMNAAQMEAKKNKTNATFTVTLKDNVNLMGKFLLPKKGYDSISIVSEGGHIRTMTFTSDITLTGNTSFTAVSLKKVNKKNEQVKGKIKKGKYTLTGAAETF